MNAGDTLRRRTIHGVAWQLGSVGGQRAVQLAGPIVLARTLQPADIGLFGLTLATIAAIEALTAFLGEQAAISSEHGARREYLDTVFTVRILRGAVIGALLCALAPVLASITAMPADAGAPALFFALAGNGLLDALQSPARSAQLKELHFQRIAVGDFCSVVAGTALTVTLALVWRDVWALVVGHVGGTAVRTAVSYLAAPHRPRLRLDREVLRELLRYNAGAAGTPLLLLLIFAAPAFVLARTVGQNAVAVFEYSSKVAKLPEDLFLRVLGSVAIPAYASMRHDRSRLARAWLRAVHSYLVIGGTVTLLLAWCGNALPRFVFTPAYGEIDGLFSLLALHGGLAGLTAVVGPMFWATGRPHLDRRAQLLRCAAMFGLGVPAAIRGGVIGFAAATCVAVALALVASMVFALRMLDLRVRDLARASRDGVLVNACLATVLLTTDALLAPADTIRILCAGAIGGPVLALLALRVCRTSGRAATDAVSRPGPLAV